jgi:hypothetical protein
MADPEVFILDQFPRSSWPAVPTLLRTAYAAVGEIVQDEPMLQIESAEDNRGRLITWAVDFGFVRAINSGAINCEHRWRDFARPTGRYLELRFPHSTASVSQVANPARQPRNVVFRENARLRNEWLFPFPEFQEEMRIAGLPHWLFLHGHQSLNFAHIAVPSPDSNFDFVYRSTNLMNIPHEMPSDVPPPEHTDDALDEIALLKEDIERWRRDNGDE